MDAPRTIRIIAHGERSEAPLLAEAVHRLRDDGHDVAVRPTWEKGDAEVLAKEAADLDCDMVVAAGGDGTVHEVVNGLMSLQNAPALGLLPLGTANDFARSATLSPDDPAQLAAVLAGAELSPVDVIAAGDRYFLNVATCGFAADAGAASDGLKQALGGIAYLLSGVARLTSAEAGALNLTGPGFQWEGEFYGLAIGNGRCAGGGNVVCPDAVIDDGELDVVVLPADRSLFQSTRVGADLRIEAVEEQVLRWRAPWVRIQSPEPIRANMDGEPYEINGVRFEVRRHALRMALPADAPILTPR